MGISLKWRQLLYNSVVYPGYFKIEAMQICFDLQDEWKLTECEPYIWSHNRCVTVHRTRIRMLYPYLYPYIWSPSFMNFDDKCTKLCTQVLYYLDLSTIVNFSLKRSQHIRYVIIMKQIMMNMTAHAQYLFVFMKAICEWKSQSHINRSLTLVYISNKTLSHKYCGVVLSRTISKHILQAKQT